MAWASLVYSYVTAVVSAGNFCGIAGMGCEKSLLGCKGRKKSIGLFGD
jgi:hypothetical protein